MKKPRETDLQVGSRVKARRRQLQISQTELGKAIGITFQQIQKYENGSNRISSGRLQEIAQTLRVPVTHFFDSEVQQARLPAALTSMYEFLKSPEGSALVRAFCRISNLTLRRSIVKLVVQLTPATGGDRSPTLRRTPVRSGTV